MSSRCCSGSYPPRRTSSKRPSAEIVSGGLEPRAGVRDEADPGEDLIRLDDDVVATADPLDPRRPISERPIDAGLPQIGRFEHVRVRRENQRQHAQLLPHPIAGNTFGNWPIAVKVSALVIRARRSKSRLTVPLDRGSSKGFSARLEMPSDFDWQPVCTSQRDSALAGGGSEGAQGGLGLARQ